MSGIIGVYSDGDVALDLFYGLYSIQHRGQDHMGLVIKNDEEVHAFYGPGVISDNITGDQIQQYKGNIGLGHVINSYFMKEYPVKQPHVFDDGSIIAIDGKIVNDDFTMMSLKNALSSSDKEKVDFISDLEGAFSIVYIDGDRMIAVRDTNGIKPISIGKRDDEFIVSSETCAFDGMGAKYYKDLIPGEIFIIEPEGVRSLYAKAGDHNLCLFEMLYTQRPDSEVEGISIYDGRFRAGELLYNEHPVDADIVIGAPDSGIIAAKGYAEASGIPYRTGLIKNRYVQRTFIQPTEALRTMDIKLKLNAIKSVVAGKEIVLVDDSIIRGATMERTIDILKQGGAKTIHVRVAAPPINTSDNLSIYIPGEEELIAKNKSLLEIEEAIGANSLQYLSIEGLREAFGNKGYYEKYFGEE